MLADYVNPRSCHRPLIYDSWNADSVGNGPSINPTITLSRSWKITKIGNYHYNFGAGQDPTAVNGKISIYDAVSGALIGSWAASTVENTDDLGFTCLGPNMCWGAHPNVTLKAGTGLWIQTLPPGPTQ